MVTKRIGKKRKTAETKPNPEESVSNREKIALLAYKYWEERGHPGGSDQEDWYRAEREIMEQVGSSSQTRQV
jgi:hypothetical protein